MSEEKKEKTVKIAVIPYYGESVHIGQVEVRDEKFDAYVSKNGMFHAYTAESERWQTENTLDALRDRLMKHTKRESIALHIPFEMASWTSREFRFRKGTITKVHQGTHKPIVRWEDRPQTEQEEWPSPYSRNTANGVWFRPLTNEERKRVEELQKSADEALEKLNTYVQERRVDAKTEADKAIKKAEEGVKER